MEHEQAKPCISQFISELQQRRGSFLQEATSIQFFVRSFIRFRAYEVEGVFVTGFPIFLGCRVRHHTIASCKAM